jgi:hypothetical protein
VLSFISFRHSGFRFSWNQIGFVGASAIINNLKSSVLRRLDLRRCSLDPTEPDERTKQQQVEFLLALEELVRASAPITSDGTIDLAWTMYSPLCVVRVEQHHHSPFQQKIDDILATQ